MYHPRLSSVLMLLALAGCASTRADVERQEEVLIDIPHLRAVTPEWRSVLVDCSDATFVCFEAPGHFLMAFPRSCPKDAGPWMQEWVIAGHRFRFTAPDPHYPLPSGGYFSDKYPNAYLLFRTEVGFSSLWIRSRPVMTDNWGGSSVAEYGVRFVGGGSPFRCR